MNELITRLTEKAGISADQANKAIDTIKDFVKEKFPMMAGAVDNLFAAEAPTTAAVVDSAAPKTSESILDKISDLIPGETGQKVEDFAKNAANKTEGFTKDAAHKAEEVFDSVKEKLSGFFDAKKN
jgi:uncharacterized protein YjbJ (UPF0337 family)